MIYNIKIKKVIYNYYGYSTNGFETDFESDKFGTFPHLFYYI